MEKIELPFSSYKVGRKKKKIIRLSSDCRGRKKEMFQY